MTERKLTPPSQLLPELIAEWETKLETYKDPNFFRQLIKDAKGILPLIETDDAEGFEAAIVKYYGMPDSWFVRYVLDMPSSTKFPDLDLNEIRKSTPTRKDLTAPKDVAESSVVMHEFDLEAQTARLSVKFVEREIEIAVTDNDSKIYSLTPDHKVKIMAKVMENGPLAYHRKVINAKAKIPVLSPNIWYITHIKTGFKFAELDETFDETRVRNYCVACANSGLDFNLTVKQFRAWQKKNPQLCKDYINKIKDALRLYDMTH